MNYNSQFCAFWPHWLLAPNYANSESPLTARKGKNGHAQRFVEESFGAGIGQTALAPFHLSPILPTWPFCAKNGYCSARKANASIKRNFSLCITQSTNEPPFLQGPKQYHRFFCELITKVGSLLSCSGQRPKKRLPFLSSLVSALMAKTRSTSLFRVCRPICEK